MVRSPHLSDDNILAPIGIVNGRINTRAEHVLHQKEKEGNCSRASFIFIGHWRLEQDVGLYNELGYGPALDWVCCVQER